MSAPDASNLNVWAATTAVTVNGGPVLVRDAFAAIAAYLRSPPETVAAKANVAAAVHAYNNLVAAINAVAA